MGANLRASNVWGSIDEANQVSTVGSIFVNAEGGGKRQVCAVATLLVPTLDGSADGTSDDSEVERLGDPPLVGDFLLQNSDFGLVQFECSVDVLKIVGILCDQGALFEILDVLVEALFVDEGVDIGEELVPGDAGEGVLDLGLEVAC